jgi:PD-(D/E)XK nuclease superfamily
MPALPADGSLPDFLDRRPFVGTYTNLNTFRSVCEYQTYRRYVKKDIPFFKTDAMEWGDKVHSAFETRLRSGLILPREMQQWERFAVSFDGRSPMVEQKLGMTDRAKVTGFFDKDVWFRGKADAIVIQGDKAFIADWKTGGSKYEDPFELATNAVLLKVKYPELKKIMGSYVWLKEDRVGQQYDLSDFKATFMEITRLMGEIKARRDSGEWAKDKSGLCGYCPCDDCENWYEARK